jgi:HlyD family secretion protein
LKVEISIGEYDVNRVKIGQKTIIRGDGIGDEKYSGEIIKIAPIAYSESGGQSVNNVVPVEVKINESNTKFKPNFSANVEIEVASVKDAITIPFEAMVRDKDGAISIFVVEDNIAVKKNIKTGVEGELYLEVTEGDLEEGDMIIINPAANIQDGSEVIVGGGI